MLCAGARGKRTRLRALGALLNRGLLRGWTRGGARRVEARPREARNDPDEAARSYRPQGDTGSRHVYAAADAFLPSPQNDERGGATRVLLRSVSPLRPHQAVRPNSRTELAQSHDTSVTDRANAVRHSGLPSPSYPPQVVGGSRLPFTAARRRGSAVQQLRLARRSGTSARRLGWLSAHSGIAAPAADLPGDPRHPGAPPANRRLAALAGLPLPGPKA